MASLDVQFNEARERADAWPEVLAYITDAVFHFAFRSSSVRVTAPEQKSVMGGKAGEVFIPYKTALLIVG
ncbi:hypothetical protein [Paenibacillus hexagrammi]|uniref:Uncharacterized protein n=1 Tax=Paenibacillus hexagrammi TaxID=2908839 RepID=A0ABY3SDH0_9BACL|nr:hypothetical protein [Paenibacillus sp. YPD9-1]UJF31468.1 hypothetical protein L0M14_16740 [Paenibacillus sp. YPD9-1]